ncbi:MAG: hypothetical protein IT292_06290 [Deltaproteobacteria bacterium]|nr:hypothetical protein [Deltaproteobacteria bacterium]
MEITPFYWLLSCFCLILASRLVFIRYFTVPISVSDQWAAEAATLFTPWLHDSLTVSDLFITRNQHPVIYTKLISLLLLILNGYRWDTILEMIFNAVLAAGGTTLLLYLLYSLIGFHLPVLLVTFFMCVLPISWNNTLSGFHSCWQLLMIFSLVAFWGLLTKPRFFPGGERV